MEIFALLGFLVPTAIALAGAVFWLMMLIHCLRGDSPNKIVWVLVLLLLNLLGAVLYRVIEYPRLHASRQPA